MAKSRSQPRIKKTRAPKAIKVFKSAARKTGRRVPRPKFVSN